MSGAPELPVPARAAMGGRARAGRRPALVVIDMSRGFTDPASPVGCALDDEVAAIARLLARARERGAPVAFTTIAFGEADRRLAEAFLEKGPGMLALTPGSELVEIDPRLAPRPSEPVLVKRFPSAFFGTPLASWLTGVGADSVVLTGASTSGCVRATAVDAVSHGYRVLVPREAVGDRDRAAHAANLHDIDLKYGDVVAIEDALRVLGEPRAPRDESELT